MESSSADVAAAEAMDTQEEKTLDDSVTLDRWSNIVANWLTPWTNVFFRIGLVNIGIIFLCFGNSQWCCTYSVKIWLAVQPLVKSADWLVL